MNTTSLLSVGIDIGTSTSQLIFSRLEMRNAAPASQTPRYTITSREIIWQSPIVLTPCRPGSQGTDELHADAINDLIQHWYHDAGINRDEVKTGAIIVTGESLKTPNARATVMQLAESLGDFVVASAGPHLESVIAGRGSGAAEWSRHEHRTVLNIDIGGGTSNYAVFHMGRVIDTACLNVGGRLLETDAQGWIIRVRPPARPILEQVFGIRPPETIGPSELPLITHQMADLIANAALGDTNPLLDRLMQTSPLRSDHHYDAIMLSGGVGSCCEQNPFPYCYRDLGPLLAQSLLSHPLFRSLPLRRPAQTVRATVIGAGAWSLSLSGSTVWAENALLPLRNIPTAILSPDLFPLDSLLNKQSPPEFPAAFAQCLTATLQRLDIDPGNEPFVVCLPEELPINYTTICALAHGFSLFWKPFPTSAPALICLPQDMGKALGMELRPRLGIRPLVVLDEINLTDGDYLDIGSPLFAGGVVPVTIKSLAFNA